MIDQSPLRKLLLEFETDIQNVTRVTLEEEIGIRTRNIGLEVREGIKVALDQYAGLAYVTEDDPTIKALPLSVRDGERAKRNAGIKLVIKVLEYCKGNPRATGVDLEKLKATKFKNFPLHLDIRVLPDLARFGMTYARLAAAQSQLQSDPEPVMDSLLSPAQEADESQEETRIDDE